MILFNVNNFINPYILNNKFINNIYKSYSNWSATLNPIIKSDLFIFSNEIK